MRHHPHSSSAAAAATVLLLACFAAGLPASSRAQTYNTQLMPPTNLAPEWKLANYITYNNATYTGTPVMVPHLEFEIMFTVANLIDNCTFWANTTFPQPFYYVSNVTNSTAQKRGIILLLK